MTYDAVLQLLHQGRHLAVAITPSVPTRLAWLGVYPLDQNRPSTAPVLRRFGVPATGASGPLYRIRAFEVEKTLIDADASISETELENSRDWLAIGDDELETKLHAAGVELAQLDLPFKSSYPI